MPICNITYHYFFINFITTRIQTIYYIKNDYKKIIKTIPIKIMKKFFITLTIKHKHQIKILVDITIQLSYNDNEAKG